MKKTYHGQHLIKLTHLGVFNCYFVREEDGLTLIDAGLPGSADKIITAAQEEGQPIKRLAITHAHGDHTGSLEALCAKLPNIEIAWGTRTASFLCGDKSLFPDEPQAKLRGSFTTVSVQATRLIQPDDMMVGSLKPFPRQATHRIRCPFLIPVMAHSSQVTRFKHKVASRWQVRSGPFSRCPDSPLGTNRLL